MNNKTKLIAFYFPQFHSFHENDIWWGKGFSDWELVKKARPLFKGHAQPNIPLERDYYDPCEKDTLKKQIALAKKYAVSGFMIYHYWFDGKLLLEKPLECLLKNKDLEMPFCICWANETWTRAWIGKPTEILIEQTHKPDKELWIKHFNYLLPFFKDDRYIKIEGRPVFVIYQPQLLKETERLFNLWDKMAKENGLNGLYLIANKNHKYGKIPSFLANYDGLLKFQPREVHTTNYNQKNFVDRLQFLRFIPEKWMGYLRRIKYKLYDYQIVDSVKIWECLLNNAYKNEYTKYNLDIYESAYFRWDNTPRYGKKAKIFTELKKEEKVKYLSRLKEKAILAGSPYVFFNAWNEWSEGAYLEPDERIGYENLEVIKKVFY